MKRKRAGQKPKGESVPTNMPRREFKPSEEALTPFVEAFAPLLSDLLEQLRVTVDDFDRQAWSEFATAYLGYAFGRDEDKGRLSAVVERVLMNKLKRLRARNGAP